MIRLLAGILILPLMIAPAIVVAAPTTAPAAPVAPVASSGIAVGVEPFTRLGGEELPAWVGPAVQQNVVAELARQHFVARVADATVPTSQPALLAAGYLIKGSYQMAGEAIRFDGQIISTADDHVVGGITATGPVRDLFGLEDAVSAQAVHQLRRLTAPEEILAPLTAQALAAAVQPPSAAPTSLGGYDGSVLQAYVNANTAPSNDYADQENASRVRQSYANDYSTNFYSYGGFGGPGVFYGTSFYPLGLGGGGFGFGRYGDAGLGRGLSFGRGGNFGYGFGGGGVAFHGEGLTR